VKRLISTSKVSWSYNKNLHFLHGLVDKPFLQRRREIVCFVVIMTRKMMMRI
jgi:hypothetical protein